MASLRGFLSCLSLTDIVPGVSLAARQQGRGRRAGVGLTHPGDVAGSRCLMVPGGPTPGGGRSALPGGYFHPKRLRLLASAIPRHGDELTGAAGPPPLQAQEREEKEGMWVAFLSPSFLLSFFPSLLPSFLPCLRHGKATQHCHHTLTVLQKLGPSRELGSRTSTVCPCAGIAQAPKNRSIFSSAK